MPTRTTPRVETIELPDFGTPATAPVVDAPVYASRLERARARMAARGLDRLVVWGDREHSATLSYLTGFDPRFEEAILVVAPDDDPVILVGNECQGLAAAAPLRMQVVLHQDLSLPNQPRDASQPLPEVLAAAGIGPGRCVGTVGWKAFADRSLIDLPAVVLDELRLLVGPSGRVESATDLFIDPADGLRTTNEVDQLAAFEWAGCTTSTAVRRVLTGIAPGMTERDAARLLAWDGTPLSCHLMLTAGERARLGLLSPGDRPIGRGDPFTIAFGIWGALTCRAGFVVADADELPTEIQDYVERLVVPYFAAVAEWYQALHVGQVGGELQAVVDRHLGDPFFGVHLNPGHHLHLDEWVSSPVFRGSTIELRSGAMLQCDIIPATGSPWFTTNIEDGVALADESLRGELAARHPGLWARVQARRRFMTERLGIDLHPDVLPFSNLAAHLTPFVLAPDRALTLAG